jgi:hypothetical protein
MRSIVVMTVGLALGLALGGCGDKPDDTAGEDTAGGDDSGGDTDDTDSGDTDDTDSGVDDTGDGCDDPYPAVCAYGEGLEGDSESIDTLEIVGSDGVVVEQYTCGSAECCSYSLPTGVYTFAATKGDERLEQTSAVENSHACDHDVTRLTFVFDVAR